MKYSSPMDSRGQITVPQEIRRWLGLSTGDRVEFVVDGDKTTIRPVRSFTGVFEKYKGALGTFPGGTKQINAWLRDLRGGGRGKADSSPSQGSGPE